MGGDMSTIAYDRLSAKLQSCLRDPIPNKSDSETEYNEISREVTHLIQGTESQVSIDSDNPIFRSSDNTTRNPEFLARLKHEFTIGHNNQSRIFIMIDYSNFENTFKNIDEAQEHMNAWSDAIYDGLSKLTPLAPEIIVHVLNEDKNTTVDPLEVYNDKYHSNQESYPLFAKKEIPSIIIDCGSIKRHISCQYDGGNSDRPDFHLVYSLLDMKTSNIHSEILDAVREVGTGFAILHKTPPGMDVVSHILKLGCILAVKYTIGSTDSSLIELLSIESFQSSRDIGSSKTGAIMTNSPYKEVSVISQATIEQLSTGWEPNGAPEFYNQLKKFDEIIQTNLYLERTSIRELLESRHKRLVDFGGKYLGDVIRKKIKVIEDEIGNCRANVDGKQERLQKEIDLLKDGLQEWGKNNPKPHILTGLVLKRFHKEIIDQISSQNEPILLDELLNNKSSPITSAPKHAALFFQVLLELNRIHGDVYRSANTLYHSKIKDAPKLDTLEEHGVKLYLIDQIKMYPLLMKFLATLKNMIYRIENNLPDVEISNWIRLFYNLSPTIIQGGEDE